ncbi:MAG: adenylate kinase, partial [Clostridia bacterium]|nr:adenylate kinase [Clostridia bacterium]
RYTDLTPMDDALLTDYLWPVVREMIKTAIENKQNLTVEGCYIPAGWEANFTEEYLREIRYVCLIMTRNYLETHKNDVVAYGSAIETRLYDEVDFAALLADNEANLEMCRTHGYPHVLIDTHYDTSSAFFGE